MNFSSDTSDTPVEPFQLPSMVDLVFILLSFFILATQLRTLERDVVSGYQSEGPSKAAAAQDLPSSIPIALRRASGGVAITIGQATLALNDFTGIQDTLAKINLPGVKVLISADPSLTVDQVARAMDAVLASPMKNLSLSRLGEWRD